MVEGYCMKCKNKVELLGSVKKTAKNGVTFLIGHDEDDHKVARILGRNHD